eukprot:365843-Chlamydomonas_euryale.AAC.4
MHHTCPPHSHTLTLRVSTATSARMSSTCPRSSPSPSRRSPRCVYASGRSSVTVVTTPSPSPPSPPPADTFIPTITAASLSSAENDDDATATSSPTAQPSRTPAMVIDVAPAGAVAARRENAGDFGRPWRESHPSRTASTARVETHVFRKPGV